MNNMFHGCSNLEYLDVYSFKKLCYFFNIVIVELEQHHPFLETFFLKEGFLIWKKTETYGKIKNFWGKYLESFLGL